MKRLAFACLAAVLMGSLVLARPVPPQKRVLREGPYRIEIETRVRSIADGWGWWGAPDRPKPLPTFGSVKVWRGKERLYVPESAFAGLADAREFSLEKTKTGCRLDVEASDADGSWRGSFAFGPRGITERTIRASEFPDEDFERTTYHYIPNDGR